MVTDKIKELLSKQLSIEISLISDKSEIIADLGADSLDIVELVMAIEDAFNIEIENEEYESRKTVIEIVELVQSKL